MGSVARIWAARKIGELLNQVRLNGPDEETIAQIVRLSVRFGIITPYTSYLVEEPMPLGADAQNKIAGDAFNQAQAAPMDVTGEGAVERAMQESELQAAGAAPQYAPDGRSGKAVRTAGGRTFIYTQDAWTDTAYDPQTMSLVDIPFISAEYFALAQSRPDLAAALALGERVIVVADGKAFRVTADHADTAEKATAVPQNTQAQQSADRNLTPVPGQQQLTEKDTLEPSAVPGQAGEGEQEGGGCPPVLLFVGLGVLVSLLKKKRVEN